MGERAIIISHPKNREMVMGMMGIDGFFGVSEHDSHLIFVAFFCDPIHYLCDGFWYFIGQRYIKKNGPLLNPHHVKS